MAVVRKSMMSELANDRARWEVDQIRTHCMLRTVADLEHWTQSSGATPPPMIDAKNGYFWMHSSNWQIATSSQALDHFPIDEQIAIAALYDGIAHRQPELEAQGPAVDRVNILLGIVDTDRNQRELRVAIGQLKAALVAVKEENDYMVRHFNTVGVKPDRSDFAADIGQNCYSGASPSAIGVKQTS